MPSSITKVAVLYIVHKFVHEDDNRLKLAEACGYTEDDRQKEIASTFKHFKKHSSELHVTIQRIQPPLFEIVIPQQTSLVIYTVSLIVTIREPSAPTITKPISTNPKGGMVDPEKKKVNINITLLVGNSRRGSCPDMLNISYQGYLND